MRIAIIGTNGIPAKYGGFETLVEYLAEYLSDEYEIAVFCSSKLHSEKLLTFKGAKLFYIGLNANGWQSIFFDLISLLYTYNKFDKVLILGCSGSIFQPLFYRYKHKFIMNLGGLDWQRSKWSFFARKYLKLSEWFAVKFSGQIISDNIGIKEYLSETYKVKSVVIPYGGDQVYKVLPKESDFAKYPFLDRSFAFTVARIQPDNNIEILINSFESGSSYPLVIVGNWLNSEYGVELKNKYKNVKDIYLIDAIYDQKELNLLRSNCSVYLHGHSAGGTNPALVEAMNLGLAILAFDNNFNRYTTDNQAFYFKDSESLKCLLQSLTSESLNVNSKAMSALAKSRYTWSQVCKEYSKAFRYCIQ